MLRKNIILFGLLELSLVALIAIVFLRLWDFDFSVPFNYQGDTLWFLIPIKGMIDNGWVYTIPQLSAPFSLNTAAFPSMTNLDWSIMKVISLFSKDPGAVLNLFWLLSIVLTAWAATLSLCLLGLRAWMALILGVLYAFLPSAFMRNTAHISLVFYCVPLLCLFAIHLIRGGNYPQAKLVTKIGYIGAIAQGFNYIYFSFFAVVLFIFGSWIGCKHTRSRKPLREAAIASIILIFCSAINLLPSYMSWQHDGKPSFANFKLPQEAEIYGLKLRKMLVPHQDNIIPIFSAWAKRDHSIPFPNENENVAARLGPFAAFGLLFLLGVSLKLIHVEKVLNREIIVSIASLTLLSFLVTTVGGFGAIFNQIISPDIRCYNRFSVFIAFFSIAGLGLWLQERINTVSNFRVQLILLGTFILIISFSFYDQLLDAAPLNNRTNDQSLAYSEKQFVQHLEASLDQGAAIFQLPITEFPGGMKERMFSYDHARPYLWSSFLRWSWPSFSVEHRNWLAQVRNLDGQALAEALILSGFRAVWIDRFGYSDNGVSIMTGLLTEGAKEILPGVHHRYVALDLEPIASRLRQHLGPNEFQNRQRLLLDPLDIDWSNGFYAEEHHPTLGKKFRWSQAESIVKISNSTKSFKSVTFYFSVASVGRQGNLTISANNQQIVVPLSEELKPIRISLDLPPNTSESIKFKGEIEKVALPPEEKRDLQFYFYVMDWQVNKAK